MTKKNMPSCTAARDRTNSRAEIHPQISQMTQIRLKEAEVLQIVAGSVSMLAQGQAGV